MADGYARAKKQTSVVLSHLGPGLTNAADRRRQRRARLHPDGGDRRRRAEALLRQASASGSEPARRRSQYEIYRPFVKRAWRVDQPHLFPEIIEKAFQLAESGQPGPVLVDVPMDIFSQEVDVALFDRLALHTRSRCASRRSTTRPRPRSSDAARRPKRPVLYAGGGVLLADATGRTARVRRPPAASRSRTA